MNLQIFYELLPWILARGGCVGSHWTGSMACDSGDIHAPFYAATAQVYYALTRRVECLKVESDTQHFVDSWMGQSLAESLEMLRTVPRTARLLPSIDSSFQDHYGTKCHQHKPT